MPRRRARFVAGPSFVVTAAGYTEGRTPVRDGPAGPQTRARRGAPPAAFGGTASRGGPMTVPFAAGRPAAVDAPCVPRRAGVC